MGSIILGPAQVGYAEAGETYYVKPVLPENQLNETTDYFDIKLASGKKQTLAIDVYNHTAETKSFDLTIADSITNDYGVIEYTSTVESYDESLKYKFSDLTTATKAFQVAANSVERIEFTISSPEKTFDGIILGGIRVSEKLQESSASISNVFSYVLPVKIRQNDTTIANKLNFLGISIGQRSYDNVIQTALQNPQPEILRELTLEAKIYAKGKNEVLYEEKKEQLKMAPNTHFNYGIVLGKSEFKAGHYRLELTATAEDLSEKWVKEFEITAKEAAELNDQMVFKEKKALDWKIIALALGILILLIGLIIYLQRQRKAKKLQQKKRRKKRKKNEK